MIGLDGGLHQACSQTTPFGAAKILRSNSIRIQQINKKGPKFTNLAPALHHILAYFVIREMGDAKIYSPVQNLQKKERSSKILKFGLCTPTTSPLEYFVIC